MTFQFWLTAGFLFLSLVLLFLSVVLYRLAKQCAQLKRRVDRHTGLLDKQIDILAVTTQNVASLLDQTKRLIEVMRQHLKV